MRIYMCMYMYICVYHALKFPGHASMAGNPLLPSPDIATLAGVARNPSRAVWNEISHVAG